MALTGGRTPDVVYEALLKKEIDWSKVTLLPTDDRLVTLDDPLSNYAKLTGFFGKTGAEIVSLIDEAALGDYREAGRPGDARLARLDRSEEHTSELQSLMRITYAVFCLNKK